MAIKGYFFNAVQDSGGNYDRVYNSEDVTSYLDKLVGNGVFPTPSTQLQVVATGTGTVLTVQSGQGWIDGHKLVNTTALSLELDASDALLNRIDRIVFYCDYDNREMGIDVVKGTPAVTAEAPALTRNASRYEMCLAEVAINAGAVQITAADVTDTRADSSICGWVAGLIQQLDTSTLFLQWQAIYSDYYESTKDQLDAFMETLTEELRVNTYVVEFKGTAVGTDISGTTLSISLNSYTFEGSDIVDIYINGLKATKKEAGSSIGDYVEITGSGSTLTVVFADTGYTANDVIEVRVLKSMIGITNLVDNLGNTLATSDSDTLMEG